MSNGPTIKRTDNNTELDKVVIQKTEYDSLAGDIRPGGDFGSYDRDKEMSYLRAQEIPWEMDEERAKVQTGAELTGKFAGQMLATAAIETAKVPGYLYEVGEFVKNGFEAQDGFNNAYLESLTKVHEQINPHVYLSKEALSDDYFSRMKDPTFWANQGQTVGTTLSLMIPSIGVAKLAAGAGKLAAAGAAGLFSRTVESAMEANQAFESYVNDPEKTAKYQQEEFVKIKPQVDLLISELSDLEKQIYNPDQENYQLLEGQRQGRISEITSALENYKNSVDLTVKDRMNTEAGQISAKTYAGNIAMAPIDMLQYALLLKPFSGLQSGIAKATGTKVGQLAQSLVVQPATEAAEEGYQFLVTGEAEHSVTTGDNMFGKGFNERLTEYAKDPHFQDAVTLGAAMGLLFDRVGSMATKSMQKVKEQTNKSKNKKLANNPDAVFRENQKFSSEAISDAYIPDVKGGTGNIDTFIANLSDKMKTEKESGKMSEDDLSKMDAEYNSLIKNANKVKEYDKTAMKDARFAKNPNLRKQYVMAKLDNDIATENVELYAKKLEQETDRINSKNENSVQFPAIEAKVGEDLSAINDARKNIVESQAAIESFKKTKDGINKSNIDVKAKKKISKQIDSNIKALKAGIDLNITKLKESVENFNETEDLELSNKKDIQEYTDHMLFNQYKSKVANSELIKLEKIEKPETEEDKINKEKEAKLNKIANEEYSKKIDEVEDIASLEKLSEELKSNKNISKENATKIKNKLAQYKEEQDVHNNAIEEEITERIGVTDSVNELNKLSEDIKADQSIPEEVYDNVIKKLNERIAKLEEEANKQREENTVVIAGKGSKAGQEAVLTGKDSKDGTKSQVEFPDGTKSYFKKENLEKKIQEQTPEDEEGPKGNKDSEKEIVLSSFESKNKSTIVSEPYSEEIPEENENEEVDPIEDEESKSILTSMVKAFKRLVSGKTTDEYKNGNLIIKSRHQLRSSIPGKFKKDTKVVIAVDKTYLSKNKSDLSKENLPIGIWDVEDWKAGKEPTVWLKVKDASDSDIAIRDFIYNQVVGKNNKIDNTKAFYTTIKTHKKGFFNKTQDRRSLAEQLKNNKQWANDAFIVPADWNGNISTKDNNGDWLEAEKNKWSHRGMAYVVVKGSDGKFYPSVIKQYPISHENHENIRKNWIDNTFGIIKEFAIGNELFEEDIDYLRDEIATYFGITDIATSKEAKLQIKKAKAGGFNNHFAIGYTTGGELLLQLPGKKLSPEQIAEIESTGGIVKRSEEKGETNKDYVLRTDSDGNLIVAEHKGFKNKKPIFKPVSEEIFRAEFEERMSNKFPNIKDIKDPKDRAEFRRLKMVKGKLQFGEPGHYFDFLSESGAATTKIHGQETSSGEFVFTASPILEINSDIDSFTEVGQEEESDIVPEKTPDSKDTSLPEHNDQSFEQDLDSISLDEMDEDDFLVDGIDINQLSLKAFKGNDDVVNTFLMQALAVLDKNRSATGFTGTVEEAIEEIRTLLKASVEKLNKYSSEKLTPEEALKQGVSQSPRTNKKVAERRQSVLDKWEPTTKEDKVIHLGYKNLILHKHSSLELNSLIELMEEVIDNDETTPEAFEGNRNFKKDPIKSASSRIRRLFRDVVAVDASGKNKVNALGFSSFEDPNAVFNYLSEALSNLQQDRMMDELKSLSDYGNFIAKSVYSKLSKINQTNPEIVDEFFTVMKKQKTEFITLKLEFNKNENNLPKVKAFQSNRSNISAIVEANWAMNFYAKLEKANAVKVDDGSLIISEEYKKMVMKKFNDLYNEDSEKIEDGFIELLSYVGIDFSHDAYDKLKYDFFKKRKYFIDQFGASAYAKTWSQFTKEAFGPIFDSALINNSSPYENETSSIRNLARYQGKFELDATSAMFKNGKGDNIFSFVNPHYQSVLISELKSNPEKIDEMNKDAFQSKSSILQAHNEYNTLSKIPEEVRTANVKHRLKELSDQISNFNVVYFDSAKNDSKGAQIKDYEKQSAAEKEVTKLALFLNADARAFLTFTPTPSDKTTFSLMRMLKVDTTKLFKFTNNRIETKRTYNEDQIENQDRLIKTLTETLITAEVDRINQTVNIFNKAKEEYNRLDGNDNLAFQKTFGKLIEGYHYIKTSNGFKPGTGSYFFMLPGLNDVVLQEQADGTTIRNPETFELTIPNDKASILSDHMIDSISELVLDKIELFKNIGVYVPKVNDKGDPVIEKGQPVMVLRNVDSSTTKKYQNNVEKLAVDYVINNILATSNAYMLTTGDPAKFGKKPKPIKNEKGEYVEFSGNHKDYMQLIDSTHSNMFKRIAKDIAPGLEGKWEEKEYRIAIIKEPKIDAEIVKYGERIRNTYANVEYADAQEWTTFIEHIKVLRSVGRISEAKYKELFDIYKNEGEFTTEQLATILQPMKPVQVVRMHDEELGHSVDYYIKTSSFPLIPQLTKQFPELNRLRTVMETNGIDRLIPPTAVKVGTRNVIDLDNENEFNEDGVSLKDLGSLITLNREGFRIQQDVPYDESKDKYTESSQFRKIITGNLANTQGEPIEISMYGKSLRSLVKGASNDAVAAKKLNDKIHNAIYNRKFSKLLDKLGVDKNDLSLALNNVEELKAMMVDEGYDRGYSINDILALRTIVSGDYSVFEIPLYFHPMVHKMESLLTSMIKNKVLKSKLPGKAYVQGSSFGFRAKTEEFLKLTKEGTDGVLFDKTKYNSETGLKTYIRESDGALVNQIMLPMPFKIDVNGKKVPLSPDRFRTSDGFLDTTKLPQEMLDMIGYRIPGQKFSSTAKLEVVGILPETMGDLVIIPPAMSAQMGSDFDVDKLYVHWFNYTVGKDGAIKKIKANKSDSDLYKDYVRRGIPKDERSNIEINKLDQAKEAAAKYEMISYDEFQELPIEDKLTTEQLENMFLDLSSAILSHEEVQKQTIEQLDNPIIKDVTDKLSKYNNDKNMSPMQKSVVNDMLHSNMVEIQASGQIGIGIESTASMFHLLSQNAGIYLTEASVKFSNKKGDLEEFNDATSIVYNAVTGKYNPISNTIDNTNEYIIENEEGVVQNGAFRLDKIVGFDGRFISDVLTNIQTESVDNANNRLLYPMNLNSLTFDVANLIARSGFNEEFIGFFLNQPIIKEFQKRLDNTSRFYEKSFIKDRKYMTYTDLSLELFSEKEFEAMTSEEAIENGEIEDIYNISMDEMIEGLENSGKTLTLEQRKFQYHVLTNFYKYDEIAKSLNDAQKTANVDTKYLGASVNSISQRKEDMSKLANEEIGNLENLHVHNEEYTTQGMAHVVGVDAFSKLFSNILPLESPIIKKITDDIASVNKKNATEEDLVSINMGIRSSLYNEAIKSVFGIKSITALRKRLLYGDNSLGNRLDAFRATTKKKHPFLLSLDVNRSIEENDPTTITHLSSKTETVEQTENKQLDWLDLLNSKDEVARELAKDLMLYSITFGTDRNAFDFGRYLPTDYVVESGLAGFLRDINFYANSFNVNKKGNSTEQYLAENFFLQYIQHNQDIVGVANNKATEFGNGLLTLSTKIYDEKNMPYVTKTYDRKYNVILWKLIAGSKNKYERISTLGTSGATEYDISRYRGGAITVFQADSTEIKQSKKESTALRNVIKKENLNDKFLKKIKFEEGHGAILDYLSDNAKSDFHKKIAQFMKADGIFSKIDGVKLELYDPEVHGQFGDLSGDKGMYNWKTNTIVIVKSKIKNQADLEHTILHELVHAFTSHLSRNPDIMNDEQKKAFEQLNKMIKTLKKDNTSLKFAHFLSNEREFIAGAFSNEEFKNYLNSIEYNKKSAFKRFFEWVSKSFGIKVGTMAEKSFASIVGIIRTSESIQRENAMKEQNIDTITPEIQDMSEEIKKYCQGIAG